MDSMKILIGQLRLYLFEVIEVSWTNCYQLKWRRTARLLVNNMIRDGSGIMHLS
jgi:hypothetical protein